MVWGVDDESQSKIHNCIPSSLENGLCLSSVSKSIAQGAVELQDHGKPRALVLPPARWIHFKYLCKCVSELKCDLVPMQWSDLVQYFFGKGSGPRAPEQRLTLGHLTSG